MIINPSGSNLLWGLSGFSLAIACAVAFHKWKRRRELRCPHCGSLNVTREYFMEPSIVARWFSREESYYDTYLVLTCKGDGCSHVRVKKDSYFFSVEKIERRKRFSPEQFDYSGPVYAKLVGLGKIPGSRRRRAVPGHPPIEEPLPIVRKPGLDVPPPEVKFPDRHHGSQG